MKEAPRSRLWTFVAIGAAAAMFAMAYVAVPLYGLFCRATGYAGTTGVAVSAPKQVLARQVEIRFDTNVAPGAPLEFSAEKPIRNVKLGETALVFFRVRNLSDRPVQAVATYNVTPFKTAIYLQKLECFCFKPRSFAPGETFDLPVVFFIDPRMAKDRNTAEVEQISLSYTYFADPRAGPVRTADAGASRGAPTGVPGAEGTGRDVARR